MILRGKVIRTQITLSTIIPSFTFFSSHIVYNVADRLLNDMLQEPIKAMKWLQKIMKCRIEFVEQNINQALIGTHNSICTEALTKLEVCLYFSFALCIYLYICMYMLYISVLCLVMFRFFTLPTPCILERCIKMKNQLKFLFSHFFVVP